MEWLSLHADAVMVLGTVIGGVAWMNHQINSLRKEMLVKFCDIESKLSSIDRRLIRVETALMIHGVLPGSVAENQD